MLRPLSLAAVAALASCGESLTVDVTPSTAKVLGGTATALTVLRGGDCDGDWTVYVEPAEVAPLPPWLHPGTPFHVDASCESYYIGNPGSHCSFNCAPVPAPDVPGPACGSVHQVVLATDADAPIADHRLRVRIEGCGREASASLILSVVGTADLPGFCGVSRSVPCSVDGDCASLNCTGSCDSAAAVAPLLGNPDAFCPGQACADPAPSGATCGCVANTCLWR
jgi:hypothetical protein